MVKEPEPETYHTIIELNAPTILMMSIQDSVAINDII